jgi:DNA-binding transcriptional regulator YiaG
MPNKIKQYRHKHKLSQRELAEKLHKNIRTIQRWESGEREPHESIYMLLGISDEELSKLRKDGDDR